MKIQRTGENHFNEEFYVYLLFLFVYNLFRNAVSSSDHSVLTVKIINEERIQKDVEGSGRGLISDTMSIFVWKDQERQRSSDFGAV
jgi:hypothetical protein